MGPLDKGRRRDREDLEKREASQLAIDRTVQCSYKEMISTFPYGHF